jgi:hypothetical protein
VALFISALVALLAASLVAWMTSGAWSPSRVRLADLALVIPVLVATKLGLGRVASLVASFLAYWMIAGALLAWYINSSGLKSKPKGKDGSEV